VFRQDLWSLVSVDRAGKTEPLHLPRGSYLAPRISPDGTRVAFNTTSDDWDLMMYDLTRGLVTRMPMPEPQSVAVWSPDSSKVAFSTGLLQDAKLFVRSADGNGAAQLVMDPGREGSGPFSPFANAWAPDGRSLIVQMRGGLWLQPFQEKAAPRAIVMPPALEGEFSADGRWLAYTVGRVRSPSVIPSNQIFVQPYPAMDRREQVAAEGSRSPVWRRDGRELFYLETTDPLKIRVMAVPVTTTPTFSAGTPHMLFEGPFRIDGPFRGYDVSADGQRFVMVRAAEQPGTHVSQMVLVQNWFEELKARVPVK
jgi:eukaryotic-like serine/threonine-protein kinase